MSPPLLGRRAISLAVNLPGLLDAARYTALGAAVTRVVPPPGDPPARVSPAWHAALQAGCVAGFPGWAMPEMAKGRRIRDEDPIFPFAV